MSDELPVMENFYPLLAGSYIRLMVVVACIKNEEAGNEYALPVKFKIARDYYEQLVHNDITSPLLGLKLDYDEASQVLTVMPEKFVLDWYTNKIMKEVALKQAEDFKIRYSKFIEPLAD